MPVIRDTRGRFTSEPSIDQIRRPGTANRVTFAVGSSSSLRPAVLNQTLRQIEALPPNGLIINVSIWGGAETHAELHVNCRGYSGYADTETTQAICHIIRDTVPLGSRLWGSCYVSCGEEGRETSACPICLAVDCREHNSEVERLRRCECCHFSYIDDSDHDAVSSICPACEAGLPYYNHRFIPTPPAHCDLCHHIVSCTEDTQDPLIHSQQYEACSNCQQYLTARISTPAAPTPNSIQAYSTKKAMPTFYPKLDPTWLYMGVELETDTYPNSNQYPAAELIRKKFPSFLCKSDSSLCDGVELVSEPATLTYHKTKMGWTDIADIVRAYGGVSHKSMHCGLHVHVNKTYFGVPDSYLWTRRVRKIASICYRFNSQLFVFSRRSMQGGYNPCTNVGVRSSEPSHTDLLATKSSRYGLNIMPPNTIEFRFFRGTLRASTFFATLEFVDFLCHIAKFKRFDWVKSCTWADLIALAKDNPRYQFLTDYLVERKLA